MTKPKCPCGLPHPTRTVTMGELLAPHRLVALLSSRPDVAGIGLACVAQGIAEGA